MAGSITRLTLRKLKRQLSQFLGMNILILVGVAFFVTLYTIYLSYSHNADKFFKSQNYADISFYGVFDENDVETIAAQFGINTAQGRYVRDFKEAEVTLRVISLTNSINMPYLYEGAQPSAADQCLLLRKHAQARDISVGSTISLGGKILVVTGLVASPEYVYLVNNERDLMSEAERFGVVFVSADFFDGPYNEIVATGNLYRPPHEYGNLIDAVETVAKKEQLNYTLYLADLDQLKTFAYIFPLIFTLLIVMIIFVTLRRTVTKDRRQIGIYKALGVCERQIFYIYTSQAGFTALIGAVLGCITALLICDVIIGFFTVMFEVPGLSFRFYPVLWICAFLFSAMICVLSAILSVQNSLKPLPAALMRPRMPSGGKQILLERIPFLWRRLSFNTRYALKSAFRNKGRFFAVLTGMCGSCGLLVFSLGFFDSAEYTQTSYFKNFAQYDVLLEFEPIPLYADHPMTDKLDSASRALAVPVKIKESEYRIILVENDFDKLNIDTNELKNGVIIPEYYAHKWKLGTGDLLNIDGVDVEIVGLSEQSFGLALYTSFDYAEKAFSGIPKVYNAIFVRQGDLSNLENWSQEYGFKYSTLEDDKTGFSSIMESLNTLIWFMLACALILGLMVLYSVGLMNLSAREFEYMFMGIMGYPLNSIMGSHIKETVLQLVLALPSGFILGNILLQAIKSSFSSDNFAMSIKIYNQSYIYAGIMVLVIAVVMAVYSACHINRLDIVEGLKSTDE